MTSQERYLVTSLFVLMMLLWLGFIFHRDPSFPGSFAGGMLGIAAATLMFVPILYSLLKRIKPLKKRVTKRASMSKLLSLHVYAGIFGPILAIVHSAHRFDSLLGIALILMMLIVVISGYLGRYLLGHISSSVRKKAALRDELRQEYRLAYSSLCYQEQCDTVESLIKTHSNSLPLVDLIGWQGRSELGSKKYDLLRLVDTISDIEYSISMHDTVKVWFKKWLKFHILVSLTMSALLISHIAAEIYFGLRWL